MAPPDLVSPKRPGTGTFPNGQVRTRLEPRRLSGGSVVGGRYVLEEEVGRGATAVVFRAYDRVGRTTVAVKVMSQDGGTSTSARFGRELRAARLIDHPNVCRLFDVFEDDGTFYLTMEYAAGGSLRAELESGDAAARPWEKRFLDAGQVIAGLAAIHKAGLVHRDVKPENILRLSDGRLVIADLGLARAPDDTSLGTVTIGTPGYLAPELVFGASPDASADVWALGLVVYELLFGTKPDFDGTGMKLSGKRIPAVALTSRARELTRACRACLSRDRGRRPRDASRVLEMLGQGGRRRQRTAFLLAAAGLVAAAVAAVTKGDPMRGPKILVGEPAFPPRTVDLARARIVGYVSNGICASLVPPENRVLRVGTYTGTYDVDIDTGEVRPFSYVSEVTDRCPALSPDGRRLAWFRRGTERRQVMLSDFPDGSANRPIGDGIGRPHWLPAGRGFLFQADERTLAHATLDGRVQVLPAAPGAEWTSPEAAIDERGNQLLTHTAKKAFSKFSLALYDLETWKLRKEITLESQPTSIVYNTAASRFFVQLHGPRYWWYELRPDGRLSLVEMWRPVRDWRAIDHAWTQRGLLVWGSQYRWRGATLTEPDGRERIVATGQVLEATASADGDVLFSKPGANRSLYFWSMRDGKARLISTDRSKIGMYFHPRFSANSEQFVFAKDNRMFACEIRASNEDQCRTFDRDDRSGAPKPSPDGTTVAYLSARPTLRLVLSNLVDGTKRDIGGGVCNFTWSVRGTLWTRTAVAQPWTELDIRNGGPTGRVWSPPRSESCYALPPPDAVENQTAFKVRAGYDNAVQVGLIEGELQGWP